MKLWGLGFWARDGRIIVAVFGGSLGLLRGDIELGSGVGASAGVAEALSKRRGLDPVCLVEHLMENWVGRLLIPAVLGGWLGCWWEEWG